MGYSELATNCSQKKNDTLAAVVTNDAIRYRRKGSVDDYLGYGLIFAFALAAICLYFIPEFM